jgi:hypothetical protein
VKDKIQLLPLAQLQYSIDNDFISPDTIYFNNLSATLEEFKNKWMIPVRESWLAGRLNLNVKSKM